MLLVVQIAAGIVLGWFIISHFDAVSRHFMTVMTALVGIAAFVAIALAVTWAGGAAVDYALGNPDVGYWLASALVFLVGLVAVAATLVLFGQLFPNWMAVQDKRDASFVVPFFVAIVHIVILASIAVEIFPAIDQVSRAKGLKDTGSMLAGAFLAQWQWLLIYAVSRLERPSKTVETESTTDA